MIRQSKIENPKSKSLSDSAQCAGAGGQGDQVNAFGISNFEFERKKEK
jgi:hypothetical protein